MLRALSRLGHRINQFVFAVASRAIPEDRGFVSDYLNVKEASLFNRLPEDIRKHSIVVAKKLLELAHDAPPQVDGRELVRAGLLHDIGKGIVHLSIFDRAVLVTIHKWIRPVYDLFANRGRSERASWFSRKFYVHREHANIASELLHSAGTEEKVIGIIQGHDDEPKESDPIELVLLRKVDEGQI
jgi:putative nucleotidyltransferase with HDIG domain